SSDRRLRISMRVRVGKDTLGSGVVVEGELEGVRAQPHWIDVVLALPVDPRSDQFLAEHAALDQEGVIGLECVERLGERARHLLDPAVVLEQIEIGWLAWIETALDPV